MDWADKKAIQLLMEEFPNVDLGPQVRLTATIAQALREVEAQGYARGWNARIKHARAFGREVSATHVPPTQE